MSLLLTDNASPISSDGMMPGFVVEEGRYFFMLLTFCTSNNGISTVVYLIINFKNTHTVFLTWPWSCFSCSWAGTTNRALLTII